VYSFQSRVRYSETDESGALTVSGLLNYLQDCCLFQSEELGRGVTYSRTSGRAWLLAAWRVEIGRLPRFTERVEVSTWATAFQGLCASRNFTVDACDTGERLAQAHSIWFMFDSSKGRPVRAPEEEVSVYRADLEQDEPLPMEPARRRLPVPSDGEPAEPVLVTRAHIDTNHHVNNAQYVAMAHAALPAGATPQVRVLEAQYSTAARLGDTVYPRVHWPGDADPAWTVTLEDAEGHPYAVVRLA
jgi:acyl-ACP thioesterase